MPQNGVQKRALFVIFLRKLLVHRCAWINYELKVIICWTPHTRRGFRTRPFSAHFHCSPDECWKKNITRINYFTFVVLLIRICNAMCVFLPLTARPIMVCRLLLSATKPSHNNKTWIIQTYFFSLVGSEKWCVNLVL